MAVINPVITNELRSASYVKGQQAIPFTIEAYAPDGLELFCRWFSSDDAINWIPIRGAEESTYSPPTDESGSTYYRGEALTHQEGALYPSQTLFPSQALFPRMYTYGKASTNVAQIIVSTAQTPVFNAPLVSATYLYSSLANALDGTATVLDGGTVTYQWQKSSDGVNFSDVFHGTAATYRPPTYAPGVLYYRVIAKNTLSTDSASAVSNIATIKTVDNRLTAYQKWAQYLDVLGGDFVKLAKLEFLQPDGTVAFAIDNNAGNKRSGAFIQDGTLSVNLQNGQRRKVSVTLSNLDGAYDFNINSVWFGQQIRLMMGVLLPNGEEYYFPQGVFYVSNPQEIHEPGTKTATYELVDKWAYLDGTLFGNLDSVYEVALNENVFRAIESILQLDRGNGYQVDPVAPIFTEYYNGKTVTLTDGSTVPVTNTPYTYRCDGEDGSYADIVLEMNTMLAGWIGYDRTGRLRLDASDEDILDTDKPVLWDFTPDEKHFLGATYQVKNTEVYNDIIIEGESLTNAPQPKGRATNTDPRSDTNIYGTLGKRTKRMSATGYYADAQCQELARWYLKRYTVLQKSVTIRSTQMFHLEENALVTIRRTDKPGSPVERHLITGYSLPIGQTGEMTINATSVNDFVVATLS